jgi:hypothetical protein
MHGARSTDVVLLDDRRDPIEAIVCRRRMACSMGKTFPTPLIYEWSPIPDDRKMALQW